MNATQLAVMFGAELDWFCAWPLNNCEKRSALSGSLIGRGELSYLAPLGSENISAPYFKSNATPPSPKTEITNILFYILKFASIIKFKM